MKRPHFTDDDSEFSRAGHYRGIVDIDYDGKNRPYRRSRGIMDMDDQSYQQVENDDRLDDFWQDMMFDRHGYGSGIREIETLSTDKQNEELRNKSQQRSPTGSHDKKKSTKASNPVQIDGHSERTPLNQDKMVLAGEECPHLNTQKPRTPSALSDLHDASSVLHVPVPEMPREFSSKAQEVNMIDYTVLNESQLEAVQSTEGYYRVVASAGSGKTRALAYRYAFLVDEIGIPPQNIACVTFTNKAANEMRERIRSMLGDIDAQYICTFHGLGVKILHEDIKSIGWPTAFRIMDDDDMTALLRRVCKKLGCHTQPNMMDLKSFISFNKTKMDSTTNKHYLYVEELMKKPKVVSRSSNSFVSNEEIYKAYLNEQIRSACLDFNDLICIPLYLFSHHPEIKDKWAKRFEYVMVDEFQDVSGGNYDFCESISSVHKNLFVVGDPDQLIYSWRGADMKYIMRFEEMHPGAKTIMLNKNYRCSGRIIDVANQLINSNRNRLKKSMIAHKPQMEQVQY